MRELEGQKLKKRYMGRMRRAEMNHMVNPRLNEIFVQRSFTTPV